MSKKLIKKVFLKTIPVMTGYLVLGIGFGILSVKNGFGPLWVLAMSTLIYAGSMQYLTIGLLTGGASVISAALATLMVNARHLFYGISMVDRYQNAGIRKPYMIFALTDETYSLVCGGDDPEDMDPHTYCFWVSVFDHCYWIVGSMIGAVLGTVLKINFAGIDFAMTALFVTVFVEQWLSTGQHIPALTGLIATVICRVLFGGDSFLIPSMLAITAILTLGRRQLDNREVQ